MNTSDQFAYVKHICLCSYMYGYYTNDTLFHSAITGVHINIHTFAYFVRLTLSSKAVLKCHLQVSYFVHVLYVRNIICCIHECEETIVCNFKVDNTATVLLPVTSYILKLSDITEQLKVLLKNRCILIGHEKKDNV